MKDFGTSKSPKSTRSSTTYWCPGRPGHPAFRHNIASSLRLHTGLPYDWTPRSDAPLGSPLAPSARWISRVASRLPGTTRLRFTLRDQLVAGLPPAGFQTSGHGRMVHLSFFDSASRRSGQHFLNGTAAFGCSLGIPFGAFGTSGIPCRLAATGDYPPSLRSPWRAANDTRLLCADSTR